MARVIWSISRKEDLFGWSLVHCSDGREMDIRGSDRFETVLEMMSDYKESPKSSSRRVAEQEELIDHTVRERHGGCVNFTKNASHLSSRFVIDSGQVLRSTSYSSSLKRRKSLTTLYDFPRAHHLEGASSRLPSSLDVEVGLKFAEEIQAEDEIDDFAMHCNARAFPITKLPVLIDGVVSGGSSCPLNVCLTGSVGNGRVKQRVAMWTLRHRKNSKPLFLLKVRDGGWLRLGNPEASYVTIMGEAYTLAVFLDFVKKWPSASADHAEKYLVRTCSNFGGKPSLDMLSRHLKVIKSFAQKDRDIRQASVLRKIFPNISAQESKPSQEFGDQRVRIECNQDLSNNSKAKEILIRNSAIEFIPPASQVLEEIDLKNREISLLNLGGENFMIAQMPLRSKNLDLKEKLFTKVAHKEVQKRRIKDLKYCPESGNYSDEVECSDDDLPSHRENLHRDGDDGQHNFTSAEVYVEDPPICILCDDGGDLLYCEGPCQRHFHPTVESGIDSFCDSLQMTGAQVQTMGKFFCDNCKYMQHQCFICGELGSSSTSLEGQQEVKCCDIIFCKRFFHVECAAEMVAPRSDWRALANDIHKHFKKLYCPRHCCSLCGEAELQIPGKFVQCRRCPKAWHRSCLLEFSRSGELDTTPIWTQYGRDFMYCRNHEIDPTLLTPKRDHMRFPSAQTSHEKYR